jgi:hypothetical protein
MHGKQFITKNPSQKKSNPSDNKLKMPSKCNLLFTFAVAFVLLFISSVEQASSSIVTFEIEGALTEVFGPSGLAVGDPFTGTFSYSLGQTGTNVPPTGPAEITRYVFDTYSLTIQGQTISATGGDIGIYNQSSFDHFGLNDAFAGVVTGSINGISVSQLFLGLTDITGTAFTDTSLPPTLTLADFPDLRRIDIAFSPNNGSAFGEITNLSVVPVPAAIWLFISGLGGLALLRGRNKTAKNLNG